MGANGQTGRLAVLVDGAVYNDRNITLATGGTGEFQHGNGTWGDPFDITNADRPLYLFGSISGSGNFVKLGRTALVLTASNTWSGTTRVSAGALRLGSTFALPGGIGATGGTSALIINSTNSAGAVVQLGSSSGDF
jgi:autotransporter-associated beta strand protein